VRSLRAGQCPALFRLSGSGWARCLTAPPVDRRFLIICPEHPYSLVGAQIARFAHQTETLLATRRAFKASASNSTTSG
jgi:hypothetical protein